MVPTYSATHFLVDFACAFLMFRHIAGAPDAYLCVLLYNFLAFALQMPLGIVADKLNRNHLLAALGTLLAAAAYALPALPVAAVAALGVGNAMFHIGGGVDVLNISEKKLGALGVFVSPGALGVYCGTLLGKGAAFPAAFIPPALAIAAGFIAAPHIARKNAHSKNAPFSLIFSGNGHVVVAISCLFLVVCLRSFVGLTLDFPWKSTGPWATALICAVVLGKTLGGFSADRFGLQKTTLLSLGLATLLFLFPTMPPAGVTAVLLFNMTMPITLWALAKILPGAKGFAFGLLAFGLFLGFLPRYLGAEIPQTLPWLFAALAATSLALLWTGLRKAKL
jgi:FSR family fosmidomycin resistance protein-like MFS transporter